MADHPDLDGPGSHGRPLAAWRRRRADRTAPRLRDSAALRRRRAIAGAVLAVLGLGCIGFGVVASQAEPPPDIELDPAGATEVPATRFFQSPWIVYAQVEDPRRPPTLTEIGCAPEGDLALPAQPEDLTIYGSRVVGGTSIAAVALLSRSGEDAAVRCSSASSYAPLWLMPSSAAEPFTANAIAILGAMLAVAGLLLHPATVEIPQLWRERREQRRG